MGVHVAQSYTQSVSALMDSTSLEALSMALRITVAIVLALSFFGKAVIGPSAGALQIRNYRFLPDSVVGLAARGLPALEFSLSFSLLFGLYVKTAMLTAGVLFLIFGLGMASVLARGISIECGCFGSLSTASASWPLVIRNLLIASLLIGVALFTHHHWTLMPTPGPWGALFFCIALATSLLLASSIHKHFTIAPKTSAQPQPQGDDHVSQPT